MLPANGDATLLQRSCEQFVASDRYAFAWIGRLDSAGEAVVPAAAAGIGLDDLEEVSLRSDSPRRHLMGEAVRTREIEVERDVRDDAPDADREAHARDVGYRSMAAVPMVHDGTLHDVLHLATDRPDAFDTDERDALDTLFEPAVGRAPTSLELTFSHDGCEVVVHADGEVTVTPPPERGERLTAAPANDE